MRTIYLTKYLAPTVSISCFQPVIFHIDAVPAARIRLAREQLNIFYCMGRTVMHDIQILSLETFANHFAAVPYLSVATLSFMPLE